MAYELTIKKGDELVTALELCCEEEVKEILYAIANCRVQRLKEEGYEAKIIESPEEPEVYSPTRKEYLGLNIWIVYWPSD